MDMGTTDTGSGQGRSPQRAAKISPGLCSKQRSPRAAESRSVSPLPSTVPQPTLMTSEPVPPQTQGRRRDWTVGGFVLLSLVTHGLLLGLPWPQSPPPAPPAATAEDLLAPPMDVVTLPNFAAAEQEERPEAAASPPPEATAAPPPQNSTATAIPRAPVTPAQSAPPTGVNPASSPPPSPTSPPPTPASTTTDWPPPPGPRPLGERLQDPQGYVLNPGARVGSPRGRSSALDLVTWQGTVAADLIDTTEPTLMPVDLVVPHALRCAAPLTPSPQPGLLAVIVDRSGQVSHGPAVIYSSQYDLLDEQAIALALEQVIPSLEPPGPGFSHRLYPIAFTVETGQVGCP